MLHCFTGTAELARKALDLGFYISLSGIVTFKNARDLQDDGQDGSRSTGCWSRPTRRSSRPVPHRGKTCEPAFVADTAAFVAELRGEELERAGRGDHRQFLPLVQPRRPA